MALFEISRYMGEDEDEEDNDVATETKLSTLYEKVKLRQLKRQRKSLDAEGTDSIHEKKKKKLKKNTKTDEEINDELQTNKHEESRGVEDMDESNVTASDKDIEKRKKGNKKLHKKIKKGSSLTRDEEKRTIDDGLLEEENETVIKVDDKDEKEEVVREGKEEVGEVKKQVKLGTGDEEKTEDLEDSIIDAGGFTVLGDTKHGQTDKIHRVLPDWLSHPSIINNDMIQNTCKIEELPDLDSKLQNRLKETGITHYFPVQRQVIPVILSSVKNGLHCGMAGFRPSDLCVSAPTGSGKTLAFVIPVVQALMGRVVRRVRALAVLPTRDLAMQIYQVFNTYCKNTGLKVVAIAGHKTFTQEQGLLVTDNRSNGFMSSADIVIATPGRLVDHLSRTPGFTLQYLRFLIIDEADRMMDQMSKDWMKQVEKSVYNNIEQNGRPLPGPVTIASTSRIHTPLQKLLFSATLSQNPEKLMYLNLFQPKLFTSVVMATGDSVSMESKSGEFVGKYTTPVGLTEHLIQCTPGDKPQILLYLLKTLKLSQVLCFTNSIEATHRLFLLLSLCGDITVAEFSASLTLQQRQRLVKQFKNGEIQIMVCSDAMARGMDIVEANTVICYDVPPFIKTYIHRVGRTARAGREGTAYTLVLDKERQTFVSLLQKSGKTDIQWMKVKRKQIQPLTQTYEAALKKLQDTLQKEGKKMKLKKI